MYQDPGLDFNRGNPRRWDRGRFRSGFWYSLSGAGRDQCRYAGWQRIGEDGHHWLAEPLRQSVLGQLVSYGAGTTQRRCAAVWQFDKLSATGQLPAWCTQRGHKYARLVAIMNVYLPIAQISINVFLLLAVGASVGILSGIFGVGGGFLLTPFLIFLGVPPTVAVASSANQLLGHRYPVHWRIGAAETSILNGFYSIGWRGCWLDTWRMDFHRSQAIGTDRINNNTTLCCSTRFSWRIYVVRKCSLYFEAAAAWWSAWQIAQA